MYISRAKMEEHIAAGRSVLHDGKQITAVAELPSEGELSAGDPKRLQAHVGTIDAEIAELTRKRTAMIAAAQAAQQSPPAGPKAEPAKPPAAGQPHAAGQHSAAAQPPAGDKPPAPERTDKGAAEKHK